MSYCINPNCQNPHHYGNIFYDLCQSCNSQLILHQKYRVIQPLEHNNYFHNYLVYEQNLSGNKTKLLKVLKSQFNQTPIEIVWREEAEILMILNQKKYPSIPQVDVYFPHLINDDLSLHCIIIDNHPKNHQLYVEKWLLYSQPLQEKTAILCLREIAY
ncbi:MAG TPA: hypothetical protein V6C58_01335, partial [Allocoleopsis sp.]